jgi:hypothetical protein
MVKEKNSYSRTPVKFCPAGYSNGTSLWQSIPSSPTNFWSQAYSPLSFSLSLSLYIYIYIYRALEGISISSLFLLCSLSTLSSRTKYAGKMVYFLNSSHIFGFGYVCVCIYMNWWYVCLFVCLLGCCTSWEEFFGTCSWSSSPLLFGCVERGTSSRTVCMVWRWQLMASLLWDACCFWRPPPPSTWEDTYTGHIIHSSCGFHRSRLDVQSENQTIMLASLTTIWLEKYLSAPSIRPLLALPSVVVVVWRTTYMNLCILLYSVGHCKQVSVVVLVDYCRTLCCTFACSTVHTHTHTHTPPIFIFLCHGPCMNDRHICEGFVSFCHFIHWMNFCGFHPFPCRKNPFVIFTLNWQYFCCMWDHHIRPSVKVDYQMTS